MFRLSVHISVLFLLVLMFPVHAENILETRQTLVYPSTCHQCGLYGQCMGIYSDPTGKYAVCTHANIYGCTSEEVGPRFYLPLDVEAYIRWGEGVSSCGEGSRWYYHRIYIDLIYKDTINPNCNSSEALAEALLEAQRVECEADEDSEFFGEIKKNDGKWCISGRCNACDSKWRDNLINERKEECCKKGVEPESGNGICLNARESPEIGISGSTLTALPNCSDKIINYESSFCEPPTSSSSSIEQSSSSESPSYSSSSEDDIIGCYHNELDAFANMQVESLKCIDAGGLANLSVDSNKCLRGGCSIPTKSSSSFGGMSSSSAEELTSSSGEDRAFSSSSNSDDNIGQCLASKPLLQKPAGYYDDWVYLGKETYGSRHVSKSSIKPGARLFDILGRTYDKVKARIKYYVFNDDIERNEFDVLLQFDVYGRIIKDSEGNDIQVFTKEDSKNGLRRDSSFYYDGYWEVMEIDSLARTIKSRTSLGGRIERRHDSQWHLTDKLITDGNNDTLAFEQYIWKNNRLAKTIFDGLERNFIYGRTLQDTVKVEPSDEGLYFHNGYNNSVGMIPDENDQMYEYFAIDPYGMVYGSYREDETETAAFLQKSSLQVLSKITYSNQDSTYHYCGIKGYLATCTRKERNDIPNGYESLRNYNFPGGGTKAIYGRSTFDMDVRFRCECNADDGNYYVSYTDTNSLVINKSIEVFFSGWSYIFNEGWKEKCWSKSDMQRTYNHELEHIKNAEIYAKHLYDLFMDKYKFGNKDRCIEVSKDRAMRVLHLWLMWKDNEMNHLNVNPRSPISSGDRKDVQCQN